MLSDVSDKSFDTLISKIKSTTKIKTGNLLRGQTIKKGSGGGFAVVKADYKIAPHTHLVENGHRSFIKPVSGKHFYKNTAKTAEDEFKKAAQTIANTIEKEIAK